MKVSKTDYGLLGELEDQLHILEEHIGRIKSGDARSVKIVAPVLRDLVCKYRSNPKPLLFRLANKTNSQLIVHLDVPPMFPDTMTLQEYLNDIAFSSGTENIVITKLELIKMVADQTSVAHTDGAVDARLYAVMGWPESKTTANSPHAVILVAIGGVVLSAGKQLINDIKR